MSMSNIYYMLSKTIRIADGKQEYAKALGVLSEVSFGC